jgi:hypothetical protein
VAAACGSAQPSPTAPTSPPALAPLPRSSIAAVLRHGDELHLDEDQVRQLQALDEQLAEANAKLGGDRPARRPPPDAGPPTHGLGMGLGPSRPRRGAVLAPGGGPTAAPIGPTLEQTLEDNDTRAYLRAESILTDAQRERARAIAEEYREQLYDRRHREDGP